MKGEYKKMIKAKSIGVEVPITNFSNMSKRKRDILSDYKIEDVLVPKWWEFWKQDKTRIIGLFCSGADVFDKADFLELRERGFKLRLNDDEAYCPDCKMIVKTNWFGGAYPESYSVECPHCSFLFAEN